MPQVFFLDFETLQRNGISYWSLVTRLFDQSKEWGLWQELWKLRNSRSSSYNKLGSVTGVTEVAGVTGTHERPPWWGVINLKGVKGCDGLTGIKGVTGCELLIKSVCSKFGYEAYWLETAEDGSLKNFTATLRNTWRNPVIFFNWRIIFALFKL